MVVVVGNSDFEPVCRQVYVELLPTAQLAVAIATSRDLDSGVKLRPECIGLGKAAIGTLEFRPDLASADADDFSVKFRI